MLARVFSLIWLSSQGRSIAVIHATTGIRGVNTRFPRGVNTRFRGDRAARFFGRLSAALMVTAWREEIVRRLWRTMRAKPQSEQHKIPDSRSALTKPVCWQRGHS
jgi:hypothetical protein